MQWLFSSLSNSLQELLNSLLNGLQGPTISIFNPAICRRNEQTTLRHDLHDSCVACSPTALNHWNLIRYYHYYRFIWSQKVEIGCGPIFLNFKLCLTIFKNIWVTLTFEKFGGQHLLWLRRAHTSPWPCVYRENQSSTFGGAPTHSSSDLLRAVRPLRLYLSLSELTQHFRFT